MAPKRPASKQQHPFVLAPNSPGTQMVSAQMLYIFGGIMIVSWERIDICSIMWRI